MNPYQKASKEYLITLLTSIKKIRKEIGEQRALRDKWSGRVDLASKHRKEDLRREAEQRLGETLSSLQRLEGEESALLAEFREAHTKYDIEGTIPESLSDTELLLERLTDAAGPTDPLKEESARLAVEAELEELKKRTQ